MYFYNWFNPLSIFESKMATYYNCLNGTWLFCQPNTNFKGKIISVVFIIGVDGYCH